VIVAPEPPSAGVLGDHNVGLVAQLGENPADPMVRNVLQDLPQQGELTVRQLALDDVGLERNAVPRKCALMALDRQRSRRGIELSRSPAYCSAKYLGGATDRSFSRLLRSRI
jgi:hypothetical protein